MMRESDDRLLRYVIAGSLHRDFILPVVGPPQVNVLGGNLPYAAVGLRLWGGEAGLLARVGEYYPLTWLDPLQSLGFDLSGIRIVSEPLDARRFLAHGDAGLTYHENPVQHFSERNLPFPPELLGYQAPAPLISSRTTPLKQSVRISDIPASYLTASAVHIAPIDYLSHLILPSIFRQGQATTLTLSPAPGYMTPAFWEEIPGLLSDVTAFIASELEVVSLFQGRLTDLWEMAEVLAGFGPEFVILRTTSSGYYLYDRPNGRRWVIPQYQATVVDPTGVADAFAGGFLIGYRETYDPVRAVLMGEVGASLVIEGSGVFYALDAMPGLLQARLDALQALVREI